MDHSPGFFRRSRPFSCRRIVRSDLRKAAFPFETPQRSRRRFARPGQPSTWFFLKRFPLPAFGCRQRVFLWARARHQCCPGLPTVTSSGGKEPSLAVTALNRRGSSTGRRGSRDPPPGPLDIPGLRTARGHRSNPSRSPLRFVRRPHWKCSESREHRRSRTRSLRCRRTYRSRSSRRIATGR